MGQLFRKGDLGHRAQEIRCISRPRSPRATSFEPAIRTRYPGLHITFVNSGVPGDTVYGGYTGDQATRLQRDVFPQQPTVITVMLGMNDGYYVPFEQKYFNVFTAGYRALLAAMQKNLPAARITLLTPTPYDEVTHGTEFTHYNEVVGRHAGFVRGFADLSFTEEQVSSLYEQHIGPATVSEADLG